MTTVANRLSFSTDAGIYAIVNMLNGHVYIGSTISTFKRRWGNHIGLLRSGRHKNPHLQAAWNKYGEDIFDFIILEFEGNPEKVIAREQYWLDFHRLLVTVYNINMEVGAAPLTGKKHSEETRRKLRGRKMSKEARRKLSIAMTGRVGSLSNAWGAKRSEETRRKISIAKKGYVASPEARRKISLAHKPHPQTEETRKKIAARHSRLYPAFSNEKTGEIIQAGRNLRALCREHEFSYWAMWEVMHGKRPRYKGWIVKHD